MTVSDAYMCWRVDMGPSQRDCVRTFPGTVFSLSQHLRTIACQKWRISAVGRQKWRISGRWRVKNGAYRRLGVRNGAFRDDNVSKMTHMTAKWQSQLVLRYTLHRTALTEPRATPACWRRNSARFGRLSM